MKHYYCINVLSATPRSKAGPLKRWLGEIKPQSSVGMLDSVTANAVPQHPATRSGSATPRADEYDEKHKETSTSASLHSKSSVEGDLAPVAGNRNENGQANDANIANPSPPPGRAEDTQNAEKNVVAIEESPGTDAPTVEAGGVTGTNAENASNNEDNEDDEIVYPAPLALGLLTFGLCLSTFAVALDNVSAQHPEL